MFTVQFRLTKAISERWHANSDGAEIMRRSIRSRAQKTADMLMEPVKIVTDTETSIETVKPSIQALTG